MEIKDVYKKIIKHKKNLALSLLGGTLLGIILYSLPSRYVASGSFFVNRKINPENGYFTYEGYYGQQTALAYTNSILALMESVDIKKMVLESNNMQLNSKNINTLNKIIKARKTGPQVISLTVKGKTYEEAKKLWNSVSDITIATTYQINRKGDENLSISPLSPQPMVALSYKSIYLYTLAGTLFSLATALFIITLKEYFKD
jgi:capsular polysaccharide biosynthesis protein